MSTRFPGHQHTAEQHRSRSLRRVRRLGTVLLILLIGQLFLTSAVLAETTTPFLVTTFSEDFEVGVAGGLPAGWTSEVATGNTSDQWDSECLASMCANVVATAPTPASTHDARLISPLISINGSGARLSFFNAFGLEEQFDGGVLEISINGGPFEDIRANGEFLEGGYTGAIGGLTGNPLANRSAWTGSNSFRTTVQLPSSAAGSTIQLRWRIGTDNSTASSHWFIDDVVVQDTTTYDVSLSNTATVNRIGDATISGVVDCAAPLTLDVQGEVRQRVNRTTVITGTSSATIECDGPTAYSLIVRGPFNPGNATIMVSAEASQNDLSVVDTVSKTLRLTKAR